MNDTWMREAIELSKRGFPAPNPHVGCVVVRDGAIVGRGFHDHWGGPHAEVAALQDAGDLAQGADVFVTLEPCNHSGRTPPCTEALISAGVRTVTVANLDPNPVAAGGQETLRRAGVAVNIGLLSSEAEAANWQFLKSERLGRPVVTVKFGASLDGKIALTSGESKWITGSEARKEGHRLRAECGCVLVGYRTVQADDPQLTARLESVVNQPLRVVLDPHNRLTGAERVFDDAAQTLHVTDPSLDLALLLQDLFARGVKGILVEGGGRTISRFLARGLVSRIEAFIAPKIIGSGLGWAEELSVTGLDDALKLSFQEVRRLGEDLHLRAVMN